MATFIPNARQQFTDANGAPLAGGSVGMYVPSTLTPSATWQDAGQTTLNPNPIPLDMGGFATIYGGGSYRQIVKDALGNTVFDRVVADSLLPNFMQAGAGAKSRTLQDKLRDTVNAQDFGATFDGVSDDTISLQKAFDDARTNGGGVIHFPRKKTTIISQSILVGSNTVVNLNGCTVKASGSFVGTNAGLNCFLFRNYNYSASALTDTDIQINGPGTFDYGSTVIAGGGAHAIAMRKVDRVTVRDVHVLNGENATAFLGCRDTLVDNCVGNNQINCYFDHWDSAGTARVINSSGRNDAGVYISQGIQFTGDGSSGVGNSADCVVAFCTLDGVRGASGQSSALIANSLASGSSTVRMRTVGNVVKNSDYGLVYDGLCGQHLATGDTFVGVDKLPIFIKANASGAPQDCRVINPHLVDCNHTSGNVALISMAGARNEVTGIRVTNSSGPAYNLISYVLGSDCVIGVSVAPTGLVGRHSDSGDRTSIIERGIRPVGSVSPEDYVSPATAANLRLGSVDATAAMAAALTAASTGGRVVVLNGGSYLLGPVTVPANVKVMGAGEGATFIVPSTASATVFAANDFSQVSDLTITNISNLAGVEGVSAIGKNAVTVSNVTFAGLRWNVRADGGGNHRFPNLRSTSSGTQKAGAMWLGTSAGTGYGCVVSVMPNYRVENGANGVQSPAIYMRRCVTFEMPSLNANCPGITGTMLQVDGDCQGINVTGTIAGFSTAVQGTVGTDSKAPIFINLDGLDFDQFATNAIDCPTTSEGWSWNGMATSSTVNTNGTVFKMKGKGHRLAGSVSGFNGGTGCAVEVDSTTSVTLDLKVRDVNFGVRMVNTNTKLTGRLYCDNFTYPVVNATNLEYYPAGSGNNLRVLGYSFAAKITTPAMPATTVGYTNDFGVACRVFIYGGTVNIVRVNGTNQGFQPCTVLVEPGESITIDYTAAPSWSWAGV